MIIYSIYRLVNTLNGKCYIGFTGNTKKRLGEHKQYSKFSDRALYRAIRKYGWKAFNFEIIYQSKDADYCQNIMEPHFIKEHDSYGENGYNLTFGGEGGKNKPTTETKLKMSKSRANRFAAKDIKGNIHQITKEDPRFISGELVGINKGKSPSKETSDKLSKARLGNKNRLGVKHSDDIKKIISERTSKALKGKPKSTIACPHCNKIGGQGNMKRYHFQFCKQSPNNKTSIT